MSIKQSVRGLKEVTEFIKNLPSGTKIVAMRAFAEYLIGSDRRGLSHEPSRKNHDESNPYQWTSEKQRKAFFASDGFGGGIPYERTGDLSGGWHYTESNSNWTSVKVENNTSYAGFVMGDSQQVGHAVDGWRKVLEIINTNITGGIRAAQKAVNEWISKR